MKTPKPYTQWNLAEWERHYQAIGYSRDQSLHAARRAMATIQSRMRRAMPRMTGAESEARA